jgi:hypothetical protein
MAQAFCFPLTHVHDGDVFGTDVLNLFQQLALDPLLQGRLQLEALVEVVLDGVLA